MGFRLLIKNIALFFLLISASSFLSTSFAGSEMSFIRSKPPKFYAGRPSTFLNNNDSMKEAATAVHEGAETSREQLRHEDESEIHERLLKVNTKDYGRYDPTPALSKPRFKLIPN